LFVLGSAHELVMLQKAATPHPDYDNEAVVAAKAEIDKNLATKPNSYQSSDGGTSTEGLTPQKGLDDMKAEVDAARGLMGTVDFNNITANGSGYGTVTDGYLEKLKTDAGKKARKTVGKITKGEYDRYLGADKGYNTADLYSDAHKKAKMSAIDEAAPSLAEGNVGPEELEKAMAVGIPVDADAIPTYTSEEKQYRETDTKKGSSLKENLKQVLETDTKENENKTKTFLDNEQLDQRRNITGRYETPRLFTNRSGYVKSSWKATDKFAAWEVVGAVDALLSSATSIDADTGSVGRVGQSSDSPSYSAPQINYKGVKGDVVTGGY